MSTADAPGSTVHLNNRQRMFRIDTSRLVVAMGRALVLAGQADQEVSLVLVSDRTMRMINRDYRGVNEPTDVLSFSMREGDWGDASGRLLGDLVISLETLARQATLPHEDGRPETGTHQRELALMCIHGLLHLLGFEHEESPEAARTMIREETRIFGLVWAEFPEFTR